MTPPPAAAIRVLVADDHAVVRQGLRAFLAMQDGIEVVAEASTGDDAVRLARELAPDVVVMDLLMPGTDGFDAAIAIRAVNPETRIVILTSYVADGQIMRALRAGALSYLPKESEPDEITAAIRKAAQGDAVIAPSIGARRIARLAAQPTRLATGFAQLTPRELEILRLIADGLNNAAIAEHLVVSHGTVKTHVSSILRKLDTSDRTQAAAFAWREGLIERPANERRKGESNRDRGTS